MSCRLLYLVGQLRPGGLERQLYYLLQTIARDRFKPAVVVWNYHERDIYVPHIQALDVPLYPLPRPASGSKRLKAFRDLVRRLKPEVIHSYSSYTNFAAWWASLGTRSIAVGAVRSEFTRAVKNNGPWLGRLSARWPRTQIFNSLAAAQHARCTRGLFLPRHLHVIRNGIDLHHFQAVPLATTGQVCILSVGSLLPVKRWDRLLGAVSSLKRRGLSFVVRLVGDGALRESLTQQTQALGIDDCVEFMGHRDDIPGLLAQATFLVHTSDSEGCPNVVMEAMACGRAVVATDVGDTPCLIDHQRTGFVVPRGDDSTLVERMATLIADRELSQWMGEAGRIKAEREFGLDRLVSETLDAYRAAGWRDD